MNSQGIWITWEIQRRNVGLSLSLGYPLYEIVHKKNRLLRYFKSIFDTVSLLLTSKPKILCVQNPSIVLATLSVISKPFLRYKLIIDSHSSGIEPLMGKSKPLMLVSNWLQKNSDITIVTNDHLGSIVKSNRGIPFILPDKIPAPPTSRSYPVSGKYNVAFITTYSPDEPINEVIGAAKFLPKDIMIYFTGNYIGKLNPLRVPANIMLLGFLPEEEYWALLSSVDFIMDLTTREGCLVCGAYEGIALSKPLILSDTNTTRSLFNIGCVYVEPSEESIAIGIQKAIVNQQNLTRLIRRLKNTLKKDWMNKMHVLNGKINDLLRQ